jgi:hypothetical protein
MAIINHLKSVCVRGVVVAEERTIINGESVAPKVKLTVGSWSWLLYSGVGVGDGARRCIIATKCRTAACEAGGRSFIVTAGPRGIPVSS